MTMAAVEGIVDFSRIDWEVPEDRLNLRLRLEGLVAKWRREELETYIDVYSFLAERSKEAFDRLVEILEDYEDCYRPWRGERERHGARSTMERLMAVWEERFGKLDDPQTQKGIEWTVKELTRLRLEEKERRRRMQEARRRILEKQEATRGR